MLYRLAQSVTDAIIAAAPPPAKPAPVTPEQTLSAITAYNAQHGDEYAKIQAALQAAGEVK